MSSPNSFHVVEFLDNQVSHIPVSWLIDSKSCYWPKDSTVVSKCIKESRNPTDAASTIDWDTFVILKVHKFYGKSTSLFSCVNVYKNTDFLILVDYKTGRKLAKKLEYTSDLETSEPSSNRLRTTRSSKRRRIEQETLEVGTLTQDDSSFSVNTSSTSDVNFISG